MDVKSWKRDRDEWQIEKYVRKWQEDTLIFHGFIRISRFHED